uniref:Uncharacterized protein n=2 Tax=Rhodosorus marinus TaxID=101924 RepID=A0A7S2ZIN1_9RHOD|mmetsp:Transcript_20346/g.82144  ORF Transcript_20346/g.82144 Transcript_20346/m.82144 type:complete len:678 (+) Transcript_20346:581-2614(+)|eukprot:CAMPEP_0113967878 /NCGR_PEP_ID=MMETSP0011_2-20120614/9193_1 /TAXON_ID=101924 /ORGANISM="Rhodosorus marinus" /LENGTH=677 /DNA_ID=CAMNT_0000980847 /DNA_START=465 /DNA_END=2498 /DNA_ORIENTATION=+ /assembly_acc=CAM_ASM_000156
MGIKWVEFMRQLFTGNVKNESEVGTSEKDDNIDSYLRGKAEDVKEGRLDIGALMLELYDVPQYPKDETISALVAVMTTRSRQKSLLKLLVTPKEELTGAGVSEEYQIMRVISFTYSSMPQFRRNLLVDRDLCSILFDYFETKRQLGTKQTTYVTDVLLAMLREHFDLMLPTLVKFPTLLVSMLRHVSHFGVQEFLMQLVTLQGVEDTSGLKKDRIVALFLLLQTSDFFRALHRRIIDSVKCYGTDVLANMSLEGLVRIENGLYSMNLSLPVGCHSIEEAGRINPLLHHEHVSELLELSKGQLQTSGEPLVLTLNQVIEISVKGFMVKRSLTEAGAKPFPPNHPLDSSAWEKAMVNFAPELLQLLTDARNESLQARERGEPQPRFGMLRVKTLEYFATCFKTFGKDSRMALYKMKVAGVLFSLIEAYPANTIVHQLVASSMEASVSPQRKSGLKAWLKEFPTLRRILDAWKQEGDRFFEDALVPTYLSIYVQMALYVRKVIECPGVDKNRLLGDELEKDFDKFCVEVLDKVIEMRAKPEGSPEHLQIPRSGVFFGTPSPVPLFRTPPPASSEVESTCGVPGNDEEPRKVENSRGEANPLELNVEGTSTLNGQAIPVLWPPEVDSLDMSMQVMPSHGASGRPPKGLTRNLISLPQEVVSREPPPVVSNDLNSSTSKANT